MCAPNPSRQRQRASTSDTSQRGRALFRPDGTGQDTHDDNDGHAHKQEGNVLGAQQGRTHTAQLAPRPWQDSSSASRAIRQARRSRRPRSVASSPPSILAPVSASAASKLPTPERYTTTIRPRHRETCITSLQRHHCRQIRAHVVEAPDNRPGSETCLDFAGGVNGTFRRRRQPGGNREPPGQPASQPVPPKAHYAEIHVANARSRARSPVWWCRLTRSCDRDDVEWFDRDNSRTEHEFPRSQ
ncbi:hypothetical protein QBC39DRAFT_23037 [Podospora conica]|nr:hypothetical protein QBC39DRAFT_23037 [Schizothecium conicum]